LVPRDLQQMPEGVPPAIIPLSSEQDELTRVVNEIRALRAAGTPLAHIMVLHASWQGVDRARERLEAEFGAAAVANPRDVPPGAHLRVCTLNAATGLESPIVFVLGAHTMLEAEGSVWLSDEERAELVRDNTRKLYMALTRAGQRLALTYVGEPPAALRPPERRGASAAV
jgi:superfamily I DNA/RNA helicase